jgi:hypothetical protein
VNDRLDGATRLAARRAHAGFQTNPPLQLHWFTDQAKVYGARRAAVGIDNADAATWGEWVADVEQPPEIYRGRYQAAGIAALGRAGDSRR